MKIKNKPVGDRLRIIRELLGYTQREFCDILNVSSTSYAYYEGGDRMIPATTAIILHEKFGVNTNWLLTGKGPIYIGNANNEESLIYKENRQIKKDLLLLREVLDKYKI